MSKFVDVSAESTKAMEMTPSPQMTKATYLCNSPISEHPMADTATTNDVKRQVVLASSKVNIAILEV